MSTGTNNDYSYGPMLSQHVKTILESGLLLDEDYEVLINSSHFKMYAPKADPVPFGLIASSLTTLGSVFVAQRYNRPVVVIPSLAATIILLYLNRKSIVKRNQQETIVNSIVKSFINIRKLNIAIIRYLKMRKECNSAKEKDTVVLMQNETVKAFIQHFSRQYRDHFILCLKQMADLVSQVPELAEDFKVVKELDFELVFSSENMSVDNFEQSTTRIQDVHTFLTSKYLNYLGLILCKNAQHSNADDLEVLLDEKLPGYNATLKQLFSAVQKEFNNLRYCTSKKLEINVKNKSSFSRQVSGKLQQTLIGAVNNLSIIMEKSQDVLGRVEDIGDDKDVKTLERDLGDLRDHALATYESLDILCRLYGILSGATNKSQGTHPIGSLNKEQGQLDARDTTTVNYDDNSEALEENYELYIPESEQVNVSEAKVSSEDQSSIYLSLMLKELRQSLKQHERFIAARSKRGIEEDEEQADVSTKMISIPKFDLKAFNDEDFIGEGHEVSNNEQSVRPVPAPRSSIVPPLPPPPPPPQNKLDDEDEAMGGSDSKRSLFDSIRTLSSQLKGREDVFGDDGDSDSD